MYMCICTVCRLLHVLCVCVGESRRKALPLWIREQLEKRQQQKMKELEQETEEAAWRQTGSQPSWKDELDEDEEEEDKVGHGKRNYRSAAKVSCRSCDMDFILHDIVVCHMILVV